MLCSHKDTPERRKWETDGKNRNRDWDRVICRLGTYFVSTIHHVEKHDTACLNSLPHTHAHTHCAIVQEGHHPFLLHVAPSGCTLIHIDPHWSKSACTTSAKSGVSAGRVITFPKPLSQWTHPLSEMPLPCAVCSHKSSVVYERSQNLIKKT